MVGMLQSSMVWSRTMDFFRRYSSKIWRKDAVGFIYYERYRKGPVRRDEIRKSFCSLRRSHQSDGIIAEGKSHELGAETAHIFVEHTQIKGSGYQFIPDVVAVHGTEIKPGFWSCFMKFFKDRGHAVTEKGFSDTHLEISVAHGKFLLEKAEFAYRSQDFIHIRYQQLPALVRAILRPTFSNSWADSSCSS